MGRCNKTIKTYLGRPLLIMDNPENAFFTAEFQIFNNRLSLNQICAYRLMIAREIGNCLEAIGITRMDKRDHIEHPINYSFEIKMGRQMLKLRCKCLQRLLAFLDKSITFKSNTTDPIDFEDWYKSKYATIAELRKQANN